MATLSPKEREEVLDLSNEWSEAGAQKIIVDVLTGRFGRIPTFLRRRIDRLPERIMGELARTMFTLNSIDDVQSWVGRRIKQIRR